MAVKTAINLLQGVERTKRVDNLQAVSFLQKAAVVVGIFLVLAGIGAVGFIIYRTNQIAQIRTANTNLIAEIAKKVATEQRYALVRDRVDKLKTILSGTQSAVANIEIFEEIATNLPASVRITETQINPGEIEINLQTASSSDLITLFTALSDSEKYSEVILDSFSFSGSIGYSAIIKILT